MVKIDEWMVVYPAVAKMAGSSKTTTSSSLDAAAVFKELESLPSVSTVQLYRAEGFPWIRVSFGQERIVSTGQAIEAGQAIARGIKNSESVYFHALRSSDVLFLLDIRMPVNQADAELPAIAYGVPLANLESDWTHISSQATTSRPRVRKSVSRQEASSRQSG